MLSACDRRPLSSSPPVAPGLRTAPAWRCPGPSGEPRANRAPRTGVPEPRNRLSPRSSRPTRQKGDAMSRPVYVTTSIPYVNAVPHVGHALEFALADALARYHRLAGRPTRLQSGSDDNSLKNVLAAEREGVPVRALVDRNVRAFQDLLRCLHVRTDGFIRTSAEPCHADGASALWRACEARGDLYRRPYRGLYCVGCEQYYAPDELDAGLCPAHGTRPETVEEENWFFRLSRHQPELLRLVQSGELDIVPETRRREAWTFIAAGLQDFSVSRTRERARGWGIPVPGDPDQVMYVW